LLKEIGNTILDGENNDSIAWRLDYSNFFEKYVQYLLSNVVRKTGASIHNNQHFPIRSNHRPKWSLAYLEPDIILQKDNIQYAIDAKYKSHIFNWNEASDTLKDDFRRDFHQVLAYSSFSKAEHKNVALVYPFNDFAVHRMSITSPLNSTGTDILMIGVPISRSMVGETIEKLSAVIRF
jgi:5-methylcytosine-specific restriction endonuclease McrBC regulatory subunit McrC